MFKEKLRKEDVVSHFKTENRHLYENRIHIRKD